MPKTSPTLGAHMSVSKGYAAAFEEALAIGGSALQIFAKSPMQSRLRAVTDEEAAAIAAVPGRKEILSAIIHASYLLNFAKPMEADNYQIKSLAEDIVNSHQIGGEGAVVHMGKTLEMDPSEAEANYVKNIEIALEQTKQVKTKVILENTAGQGSEMGYRIPDYGRIFKKLHRNNKKRVGSCIDTAHLFGGGYDLSSDAGVSECLKELHEHVGIENITCIHFNDSKKPVGSRVDRHQDIGRGMIGDPGLKLLAQKLLKEHPDLPLILETPEEFDPYAEQIKKIKSWL